MKDRLVLRLSDGWAVRADELQWMLCRQTSAKGGWKPLSFVATTKAILLRCIREKGAVVDAEGQAALDALPDSFREWKRQSAESFPRTTGLESEIGRHSRNSASPAVGGPEIGVATPATLISRLRASLDTRDGEAAR